MDENEISDAAQQLANETKETLNEFKRLGPMSFFSFDRMFFPVIARYVFIFICALVLLGAVLGVLGGLVAIVSQGIVAGIGAMIGSVLFAALALIGVRFWFEFVLVAFKINEAVQEMRNK